jgi:hypothetical protein
MLRTSRPLSLQRNTLLSRFSSSSLVCGGGRRRDPVVVVSSNPSSGISVGEKRTVHCSCTVPNGYHSSLLACNPTVGLRSYSSLIPSNPSEYCVNTKNSIRNTVSMKVQRLSDDLSDPSSLLLSKSSYNRTILHPSQRRFKHTIPNNSSSSSSTPAVNSSPLLKKILIANRGEIACRIIRTAHRLGISTVAVYSDADAASAFVAMANEAYRIGPPTSADSYLKADTILSIAQSTGCEGIHPGYGFLSENPSFTAKCAQLGIKFIGPPEKAILDMGSKSAAKGIMINAGVPVTPGYWENDNTPERLIKEADRVGYPLMIKAVKGGGGKGMRVVKSKERIYTFVRSLSTGSDGEFRFIDGLIRTVYYQTASYRIPNYRGYSW